MNSLDTNILLYGTNENCAEHGWAKPVLEALLADARDWILADQVLFEYYRLVRNPAVLSAPLSAAEATDRVRFFRERAGSLHCGYDVRLWPEAVAAFGERAFPPARTFDAILAVTLRAAGVERFYTRNTSDFDGFGFFEVVNPEHA